MNATAENNLVISGPLRCHQCGKKELKNGYCDGWKKKHGDRCPVGVARVSAREAAKADKKNANAQLRVKGGGTGVKGRDGSTRHGWVITLGRIFGYLPTLEDVTEQREELGISKESCLYCNAPVPSDMDHMIPACNTTNHQYGLTNCLNLVPCCKSCNSAKGGKSLREWEPRKMNGETEDEFQSRQQHHRDIIPKISKWCDKTKEKLVMSERLVKFVEKGFEVINKFHAYLAQCAETFVVPVVLMGEEVVQVYAERDAAQAKVAELEKLLNQQ